MALVFMYSVMSIAFCIATRLGPGFEFPISEEMSRAVATIEDVYVHRAAPVKKRSLVNISDPLPHDRSSEKSRLVETLR
jgi:hypothetical protein